MFRPIIRRFIAILIPMFTAAILSGCAPTRGAGSAASNTGGSQYMGDLDSEAWMANSSISSHKESLTDNQAASSHYGY